MTEYFSPEEIKTILQRCETDRQSIIIFLIYNYGITINEAREIKRSQFHVNRDFVLFNFTRSKTGKKHTYKIQFENFRIFYRVLKKLQDHEPLLNKPKNKPISAKMVNNDLFEVAVLTNRKITEEDLIMSHYYWSFRKGVSFAQVVEEYGVPLSGKHYQLWEEAMAAGRIWPFLLE